MLRDEQFAVDERMKILDHIPQVNRGHTVFNFPLLEKINAVELESKDEYCFRACVAYPFLEGIIMSRLLLNLLPVLVAFGAISSMAQGEAPTPASARGPLQLDFEGDAAGKSPAGFSVSRTGRGAEGQWVVLEVKDAPSGTKVLVQASDDGTNYRFPVCVNDGFRAKDVDVSVKFKPITGRVDQAAGIVWRFLDVDNYYIVRANALENNVVLYKVEKGRRSDLRPKGAGREAYGKDVEVPGGKWSTLRVVARGNTFEVHLNDRKLLEVEDETFEGAGKAGLWTKADSVTQFDDLKAVSLDKQ